MRMDLRKPLLAVFVGPLLLMAADFAAAQAYKWKDASGKVYFSDTPPPDRPADKITIRPQTAENPDAAAKSRDWRAQMEESGLRRRQEQIKQDVAERKSKNDDYNCRVAQRDLDVLKRERPVYRYGRDGQKEYLDDKDRPAALQRAQDRASASCR